MFCSKYQNLFVLIPNVKLKELVENPLKSGKHLKQKAVPSFLGDVGLIKSVNLKRPLLAKVLIFTCPLDNVQHPPKNDGIKHLVFG